MGATGRGTPRPVLHLIAIDAQVCEYADLRHLRPSYHFVAMKLRAKELGPSSAVGDCA
jgi:hypothetical protein